MRNYKQLEIKQKPRAIHKVAEEIYRRWGDKVSPKAKPYLDAMLHLDGPEDYYGMDNGKEIVTRFLSNAKAFNKRTTHRAAALKAELKARCSID